MMARDSFATLFDAASASAVAWCAQTGGKIVGYVGADVPIELIAAAGCRPFRVSAFRADTRIARRFQELGDSDSVALLANALLDGSYHFLDHLIIGNSPVGNVTLFHFLREAKRLDPTLQVPPLTLHETHRGDGDAIASFNVESCRRLAEVLIESASRQNSAIDETNLRSAIEKANERRIEIARIQTLRQQIPSGVSGTEALHLVVRWQLLPHEELTLPAAAPRDLPRVLFSGSDIPHFDHYALIEEAGCTIVEDDHDWGAASLMQPVSVEGDLYTALAKRYAQQPPRAVRWPRKQRIQSLLDRAVAARVDGVVFWISEEDQASSWDLPDLIAGLRSHGIAALDLGPQPILDFDRGAIETKLKGWIKGLRSLSQAVRA